MTHPESRLAWVSVAKREGGVSRVYCAYCDQPSPCDERVAQHKADDLHRWQCVPVGQCFLEYERDMAQGREPRKTIVIHRNLSDGGHWFCCGEGEEFSVAAAELVDADTLTALLPLVETYARASVVRELRRIAHENRGGSGEVWTDELSERADEIEAAR